MMHVLASTRNTSKDVDSLQYMMYVLMYLVHNLE